MLYFLYLCFEVSLRISSGTLLHHFDAKYLLNSASKQCNPKHLRISLIQIEIQQFIILSDIILDCYYYYHLKINLSWILNNIIIYKWDARGGRHINTVVFNVYFLQLREISRWIQLTWGLVFGKTYFDQNRWYPNE